MSVSANYDVLVIANPFLDRLRHVEHDRQFFNAHTLNKGEMTPTDKSSEVDASWQASSKFAEEYIEALGGSGTNVAKTLAILGIKVAICGKIGSDPVGKDIQDRLEKIGITPLLTTEEKETGVVNCFITPDKERTMHAYFGVSNTFTKKDISEDYFRGVRHVHIEGYAAGFEDTLVTSVAYAKKHEATISINLADKNIIEDFKAKFEECIADVDYVFGTKEEVKTLTNFKSIKKAFNSFKPHQTVVATKRADGCSVKLKGEEAEVQSFEAISVPEVIDTTGAGDFHNGGFLYGMLQGREVSDCVMMANIAASRVIEQDGTDLPENKWDEIKEQITQI